MSHHAPKQTFRSGTMNGQEVNRQAAMKNALRQGAFVP
jgi:hypothetical protein